MPNVHHSKKQAIIRDYRNGFKLWAIAEGRRVSIAVVASILVDAGIIPLQIVEAFIARNGKL